MVFGEQVGDWVESCNDAKSHSENNFSVGNFGLAEVSDVFSNVVSHLGSRSWSTIFKLNHTVVKLGRHGNNHVIVVRVEITTFRNIMTEWSSVVVSCQQVVRIVGKTGLVSTSFGKFWWPNTLVGIFSLMHSHVWWPDSIMDLSLSEVPLLEVITSVLLMGRVNFRQVNHLGHEFSLSETLIDKQIVLLMHSAVTALAGSAENFETSSQSKIKVRMCGSNNCRISKR